MADERLSRGQRAEAEVVGDETPAPYFECPSCHRLVILKPEEIHGPVEEPPPDDAPPAV